MRRQQCLVMATTLVAISTLFLVESARPLSAGISRPRQARTADGEAERVLSQARASLGGSNALDAVSTLEIHGVEERGAPGAVPNGATVYGSAPEPFGFKMRWPDRFQVTRGWFIHTLDGRAFWKRQTGGPPVPDTPDLEATARRSTELNSAYLTLAFLLRTPPSLRWEPRYRGVTKIDGLEGPTIEFVGPSGRGPKMVFDAVRHLPLAVVTTARRYEATGGERLLDVVKKLDDYRRVGGLLFPFRLDEQTPGQHVITRITSVRVNPPLGVRDFAQPVK